jgi:hypothetical protein
LAAIQNAIIRPLSTATKKLKAGAQLMREETMNMKSAAYGALCGVMVFAVLSWTAPEKSVNAAVLDAPANGRFELVQLHESSASEWSGILDTETGCAWVYASQTTPTDMEVNSAPEGEQRDYKLYRQVLGNNYFENVGYDDNGPDMSLSGGEKPATIAGRQFATLAAEEYYCNQARQSALRAAAAR